MGFKKEMSNHPCYQGEDRDSVYLYFEDEEEKEETINFLTRAFSRKKVPVKINRNVLS